MSSKRFEVKRVIDINAIQYILVGRSALEFQGGVKDMFTVRCNTEEGKEY